MPDQPHSGHPTIGFAALAAMTALAMAVATLFARTGLGFPGPLLAASVGIVVLATFGPALWASRAPERQAWVGPLAGALLISALTASFFTSVQGNPDIPDRLASKAQTELASGVPFVSDAQLETALSEAKVPPATADATVKANEQARIDGLRAAISVLALMALAALAFTGGIPTVQPGSESKPSAAPA